MNATDDDDRNSPLVWAGDLDAPLAWRGGRPILRRQYLTDVRALAGRLPANGPMLNTTVDRYRFAVGLGAALLRGHTNLLPPNHTPDTVARLRDAFPNAYGLHDDPARVVDLPMVRQPSEQAPPTADSAVTADRPDATGAANAAADATEVPTVAAAALAVQVLTSGSTGAPQPHAKHWGLLVRNTRAGARRLAEQLGRRPADAAGGAELHGVTLVATVPAQHMYGFESTVLVALLAGAAFETERPFYPVDIARALAAAPRPRMLVTTPFHLKALLEAGVELPVVDLTVCATAALAPQLAAQAEAALRGPLMEIYGCTEAGQVATRRTTAGAEWRVYDGLRLDGDGDAAVVSGGHVQQPTRLADVLEVIDAQTFRLLGRSNDLVNVAGKRSSLGHLNFHLNSIDGVRDGAFWLPPDDAAEAAAVAPPAGRARPGVQRLAAFVVLAPGTATADVLAALRQRIDPAFLPRPIVAVAALPREATGKLPATALAAWAADRLRRPHG